MNFSRIFIGIGLCLVLTNCGSRSLFSKYTPDEFAVMSRAPLSLPPDYELRPPQKDSKHPEKVIEKKTKAALNISPDMRNTEKSEGEQQLLDKIGASHANPNIRQDLTKKPEKSINPKDPHLGEVTGESPLAYDETLNPDEEAKRLETLKQSQETKSEHN